MVAKPNYEEFTQQWSKTVNWAKQNNIPYSAYYPVYQMDVQRAVSGSPLSESERVRAIEAAAGLNYSTSLPTDTQDWTNVRGNTVTNLQDIFTGLTGVQTADLGAVTHPSQWGHIVSGGILGDLFDTVKNTVEHPSEVYGAVGDLLTGNTKAAANQVLKSNNPLQFIPGAVDLAKVFQVDPHLTGNKGVEALAQTPVSSLLDIIPFGRAASEGLAATGVGERAADKLGLTTDEMRKMGIWRVGGKIMMGQKVPNLLTSETHPLLARTVMDTQTDPETGLLTPTGFSRPAFSDWYEQFKEKVGASSKQADILEARLKANEEGALQVERLAKPALEAWRDLSPEERDQFTKWTMTDHRPYTVKMDDSRIPISMRRAYEAIWPYWKMHEAADMQAGRAKSIQSPFNDVDENGKVFNNPNKPPVFETYYVETDQYRAVSTALNKAADDDAALAKAEVPFTQLLAKIDENDRNAFGAFQVLKQNTTQVYDSIQRSVPQEPGAVGDRLRDVLPGERKWSRAVPDQTPLIRNLLGLGPDDRISVHQLNALNDLFAPGGLLQTASEQYRTQDWVGMNASLKAALRKFRGKSLSSVPRNGRATLHTLYRITENLQKYAGARSRMADELNKMVTGVYRGSISSTLKGKSLMHIAIKAAKSKDDFLATAIRNPPDIWRNVQVDLATNKALQMEKTAAAVEDTGKALSAQDWSDSQLTKLHQDPRTIMELMSNSAKASIENSMLPDMDPQEWADSTKSAYDYVASLRARGEAPMWVHMLAPGEHANLEGNYDVFLKGVRARKLSATRSRTWGYTSSIYDLGAGILSSAKDMVSKDMMDHFVEQELMPQLMPAADVESMIRNYYKEEISGLAEKVGEGAPRQESALSIIERGLEHFELESFDPKGFFGEGFSHPSLRESTADHPQYYINKHMSQAFKGTLDRWQFPAQGIVDRGTRIFRFSILGLSPRYTAHIAFGGTFLVALRGNLTMLRPSFLKDAAYFARHNSFNERTLQRYPQIEQAHLGGAAAQEGIGMAQYHYVQMNSAGRNWLIPEWLDRFSLPDDYRSRIRAAADINMRFTRAIVRAQKAVVYFDGYERALNGGTFYDTDLVPRTDENGNQVYHPVTGRKIHDEVRSKKAMTANQAHESAMDAVADVMGNVRHMTPLERNILTRVFPFYGWTKHILQYVMSYPFDHPYRAMILANLAEMNSQDVASGLPTRIQLLTFLGTPDQYGNVTAIDTKALNPLRDTANYASLTGLFESLNPAITGVGALVDPQISFGGQNAYPQITYNQLYGVKTAGAGGNLFNAVEQFIPQVTALDEAFDLSGQYAYLAKSNPQAFDKKVFESLGLPFTPEQLNLRQTAAQAEIDRYQQASQATYEYATGENPNALAGYAPNAPVPDPLNTEYNVTPAYLEAMQQQSEQTTGLPYYETATPPPSDPAL